MSDIQDCRRCDKLDIEKPPPSPKLIPFGFCPYLENYIWQPTRNRGCISFVKRVSSEPQVQREYTLKIDSKDRREKSVEKKAKAVVGIKKRFIFARAGKGVDMLG